MNKGDIEILIGIMTFIVLILNLIAFQQQNRNIKKQQIENNILKLIDWHRENVKNTKGKVCGVSKLQGTYANLVYLGDFEGLNYFNEAAKALKNYFVYQYEQTKILQPVKIDSGSPISEAVRYYKKEDLEAYNDFYSKHSNELSHYFRFLYNILEYINDNNLLAKDEKDRFVEILQAQISAGELTLIFFNSIGKYGDKFFNLIENHYPTFLQNIDPDSLTNADLQLKFFPKSYNHFRFIKMKMDAER